MSGIFRLKGNYAPGIVPGDRTFDGVAISPFYGNARAAVTFSADFELSWAFRGRSAQERTLRATRCRANVPHLLRMLEKVDVPITWATVGHLFLTRCGRPVSQAAHADMPRPPLNKRWQGDWYVHDPCTSVEENPDWYAPDLIHAITSSRTRHEIGSHSFSHIDFSPATSDRELVRRELEECARVMELVGLRMRSLVYPFNNMGHHYLDLIAELGITSVRHRDTRVRLSYPQRSPEGVYKLYESMNLRHARHYDYAHKAEIFLAKAMERHGAYHLWFHPSDPRDLFDNEFRRILDLCVSLRRHGLVWIATMQELVAYCEARHQTRLEVERSRDGLRIRVITSYDPVRYGESELTLQLPSGRLVNVAASPHEIELGP